MNILKCKNHSTRKGEQNFGDNLIKENKKQVD